MSEAYKHGYSGACAPRQGKAAWNNTFSLGVFEWLPKASGKGLKKGPVKVRVSGPARFPDIVEREAKRVVAALDAGTYTGPKRITVHSSLKEAPDA